MSSSESSKEKHRISEDRSRRKNLRIDGLPESDKETWNETESKVQSLFANKLGLTGIDIERAHRIGSRKDGRSRTVVLNLLRYKDKVKILQESHKLKGTNTYVNEDFSHETVVIRKKLLAEVKTRRLNGENVYVRYHKIITLKNSFPKIDDNKSKQIKKIYIYFF
jgi:hypothetical protein